MRKVWAIARREYLAAVHTKAFIVSLVLMPLICLVSLGLQVVVSNAENATTKKYAVVDRTGQLRPALEGALQRRNATEIYNAETKARESPIYDLLFVPPSSDQSEAVLAQRLELSRRQLKGDFAGFLEIGPDVFAVLPAGAPPDDRHDVRFQSEKAVEHDFPRWANRVITNAIQEQRFLYAGLGTETVRTMQTPTALRQKALTRRNPKTGLIEDASDESRLLSIFLPLGLAILMLMLVLLGALPAMQGVVEEKQLRIAEVLLGCVTPFKLMLGKLLGVVAVSLTISVIYLGGGYAIAARYGLTSALAPSLLAWFTVFMILAVLIFGSLFMAVGAAAGDLKETQSLQMPVVMMAVLPMLLMGAVMRDPNGKIATFGSFMPFSAPMMMTARLASPGGVPWWQPPVAAAGVIVMTLACVWAAGRIFRVGLLMQGKGVHFADLAKWIVRG